MFKKRKRGPYNDGDYGCLDLKENLKKYVKFCSEVSEGGLEFQRGFNLNYFSRISRYVLHIFST